jgi:peptidoglycan hydrolase CwlO-like protein
VKEEVLSCSLEEGGITINNKEEIFLRKSFTVENLEKDINGLLEKIKKQEEKNNQLTTENERLNWILKEKDNEIERLNAELRKEKG